MISDKNNNKKQYKNFIIYKLTNPDGYIYIGATSNLEKRLLVYEKSLMSAQNQTNLYWSIKKYGFNNHKVEVLYRKEFNERLNLNIINDLEQEYIYKEWINNGDKLLNIVVRGAESGRNKKLNII